MSKKQANRLDDLLERATAALRDVEPAEAPPASVVCATLAALEAARRPLVYRVSRRISQGVSRMHPVGRLAAAAAIVLAIGAIALWGLGQRSAGLAFGEVLTQIRQVRTVKYTRTAVESRPDKLSHRTVTEVIIVAPSLIRTTHTHDYITIEDTAARRSLTLTSRNKEAVLREASDLPEGVTPAEAPNLLDDLKRLDEKSARYTGEKDIAGHIGLGFELDQGRETVWVDPQTRLPLLIQRTARPEMMPGLVICVTMSDFAWDIPVDPSLVSLTPPDGYRLITYKGDLQFAVPGEQKLIDGLRIFARAFDGRFPDSLDYDAFAGRFGKTFAGSISKKTPVSQEKILQHTSDFTALCSARNFAGSSDGDDWHYAGRGISFDQPAIPVLWYRPKGAANYHVIYADLTVQDVPPTRLPTVESTPIVPAWTQDKFGYDVSAPPTEQDLLRSLRTFAEVNDNRFPGDLGILEISKSLDEIRLRKGHMVLMETIEWISRCGPISHGIGFIQAANGSDWHYAGKGMSSGQATSPILWYRPKDSPSYRVFYADLSVRDVQPNDLPDVPSVLLLATSPGSKLIERDLVESLRAFAECNDGQFPDEFTHAAKRRIARQFDSLPDSVQGAFLNKSVAIGNGLALVQNDEYGSNWHYAGKGVKLGQPTTPIFWYQPKGAATYRVIDADLKVRTVQPETLPAVPSTALTPRSPGEFGTEEDLVEALRAWAERNGNRFPDAFTLQAAHQLQRPPPSTAATSESPATAARGAASDSPVADALAAVRAARIRQDEVSEYIRTSEKTMRISNGVLFASTVGARYAGAGVALNQPGTPICWYRSENAPTCRVIYADLSVRDVAPQDLPAPPGRNLLPLLRSHTTRPAATPP
jgi:hypothetical protein